MNPKMMKKQTLEVVLTNWKRRNNLRMIVEAFGRQSFPGIVTLIDNAPTDDEAVDTEVAANVDKYYRIKNHPYGPFVRYACYGFYEADYLYFPDDDMLPGTRCLEHFIEHVSSSRDYGVLGQRGRAVRDNAYDFADVMPVRDAFLPVDLCIRAYFVRASLLPSVHEIKREAIARDWGDLLWEDDMLLAAGCRLAGRDVALTPASNDPEASIGLKELDSSFALSARPDRIDRRNDAWRRIGLVLADLKDLNKGARL